MQFEVPPSESEERPAYFIDVGGFGLLEFSAGLCASLFILMAMTMVGLVLGLSGEFGILGVAFCLGFASFSAWACNTIVNVGGQALKPVRIVPATESKSGRALNVHSGSAYVAVRMGLLMPSWPQYMKPLVILGFAASGGLGIWMATRMQRWFVLMLAGANGWWLVALPIVLHMAFLLACNIFVVIGTGVLTQHPQTLEVVWRRRFAIDLMITVGIAVWSTL